jgi:acyl-CoA thioesterase-2
VAEPLTHFTDLFAMAAQGPDVWVGASAAYPWGRVYGGQVAAQGLWAAAQTVDPEYRAHSLHCYFIRGGDSGEPIRYEVDRIRDGRSFETRRVVARQSNGAILNLSASFQRDEEGADTTVPEAVTGVSAPDDLPARDWGPFLHRRDLPAEGMRQRTWLRVAGPLGADPMMHVIGHAYTSDDIPMAAVELAHPLGQPEWDPEADDGEYQYMSASLDHTIWFHRAAPADDWVLHDFRGIGVYGGRGLAIGEMWTRDGVHVATVAQEVLLREARR